MKFTFKIQKYQTQAVDAIVKCFEGQQFANKVLYDRDKGVMPKTVNSMDGLFTEEMLKQRDSESDEELELCDDGYRNADLVLREKELLDNVHKVQDDNLIIRSGKIERTAGVPSFDIEMETGTGKTYVYTKTMYALNQAYGWSKFIIVVPSVAIREGIFKSLEYTQEHFMQHYRKKIRFFIYNSKRLNMIDQFSSSADINVMIINTQAFNTSLNKEKNVEGRKGNEAARIIYTKRDEFASRRPIDVIAANRPILILDEPQKMGHEKSATQNALAQFKPLFVINYSATHKIQHNLVYRLDALDAYNQKLVKKIEVKGFKLENIAGTNTYIYADSIVLSPYAAPQVKLEIEVKQKNGIKRQTVKLNTGDKLEESSKGLTEYKGIYVAEILPEINAVKFNIPVSNNKDSTMLSMGEMTGNVAEKDIRRVQIRETIRSHFEKEKEFFEQGLRIKVLSLFFIDEVAKYRDADDDGNEILGEYGKMFEEEYLNVMNEFLNLFPGYYKNYLAKTADNISLCHEGYFSRDKKGRFVNTSGETDEDLTTYDLILKKKEVLLDFDMPIRFIFSHSALREGWDNPNVFQICTLKHSDNTISRRQEVGRGMRLCVNEKGNRQDKETLGEAVLEINTLTVIASESYSDFVERLQKDISAELSDSRPKIANIEYFVGKTITVCGQTFELDSKQANVIHNYLVRNNYIDDEDKPTDTYKTAVENQTIQNLPSKLNESLPPELFQNANATTEIFEQVQKLIQSVYNPSVLSGMVDNAQCPKWDKGNPLNENFEEDIFQELWKKINHKYTYTCYFNSNELIKNSVNAIKSNLKVVPMRYTLEIGKQKDKIDETEVRSGTSFGGSKTETKSLSRAAASTVKYDLVGDIAKGCKLTRKTVGKILSELTGKETEQFGFNPEKFIRDVINIINVQKSTKIVEHIKYHELEDTYDSSIFTAGKLPDKEPLFSKKAIQNLVFTDGSGKESIEWKFATDLEAATEVVVYAKLPRSFQIPTPVGNYAPDWAIAFNKDKVQHVFFVAETKGSLEDMQLRKIEHNKIECAKKLFNVVSTRGIKYDHVDSYESLKNIIGLKG
ncbi:DEAD/DEAH box helicase family protein [Treponema parvum]|uniref:DEAD/DEAH box helicase family protein n=1 Tax=Treponema parvum TaxID=138851 RepID=A0A975F088_9SPIR|nr:DEAD/DEAH box helicase family protein [Treponema parvum]QTQ12200.1 DEAD/DEAH box helicase family protein [Treponema parvum]